MIIYVVTTSLLKIGKYAIMESLLHFITCYYVVIAKRTIITHNDALQTLKLAHVKETYTFLTTTLRMLFGVFACKQSLQLTLEILTLKADARITTKLGNSGTHNSIWFSDPIATKLASLSWP